MKSDNKILPQKPAFHFPKRFLYFQIQTLKCCWRDEGWLISCRQLHTACAWQPHLHNFLANICTLYSTCALPTIMFRFWRLRQAEELWLPRLPGTDVRMQLSSSTWKTGRHRVCATGSWPRIYFLYRAVWQNWRWMACRISAAGEFAQLGNNSQMVWCSSNSVWA